MLSTKAKIGGGLLNRMINALPVELHIPGYQFCGPGTHLKKRLARGDRGINPLDAACRDHDITYSLTDNLDKRHVADKLLAKTAKQRIVSRNSTPGERAAAATVWAAMKAKTKMGMGMNVKNTLKTSVKKAAKKPEKKSLKKQRILSIAKRGGILPFIPILGALGSLIGGAAGVAKAVNDNKAAQRQLLEMQRHNRSMEGRGLYLTPYKRGAGICKKKKSRG